MNKLILFISVLILTACGGGGGGDGHGSAQSQPGTNTFTGQSLACGNYDKVRSGDYVATPNAWGLSNHPSSFVFQNCVGINPAGQGVQFNAKWNLPSCLANPIYPEIIYGLNPGTTSRNDKLPAQISSINSLVVSWDYTVTHTDNVNLQIELWLTNTATPSGLAPYQGTMVEFAIVQTLGFSNLSFPIVSISGVDYYLSAGNGTGAPNNQYGTIQSGNAPYQYRFFLMPVNPMPTVGTLDFKVLLDYAIQHNYFPANLYVSDVEFGLEIKSGSGELKLNNYQVSVL